MEKLIITVAITGASTIPPVSPYLPIPPKQIADSAIKAAEAGAAEINLSSIAIHPPTQETTPACCNALRRARACPWGSIWIGM